MQYLALALVLVLSACTSIPRICEPQSAHEAGVAEAMRGETIAYGVGATCVDENRGVFRKNLEAGYQEGRQRYCDPGDLERRAAALGKQGDPGGFQASRYSICEGGAADLRNAYKRGYAQGLGEFCAADAVAAVGRQQGEAGAPSGFPSERFSVCKGFSGLRAAYQNGYSQGLAKFCEGDDADMRGFREGNSGQPMSVMHVRFGICTADQRHRISQAERGGYDRGLAQFCGDNNVSLAAEANAKETDQPTFPPKFNICPAKVREYYKDTFMIARKRVVDSLCNYERGVERGAADGAAGRKDTAMPTFCVQTLFPVYFQGYMEGWKSAKRRSCDGEKAYEKGLSDGTGGWMMSFTPPSDCPDEFADTMRARYRDGYMAGKASKSTSTGLPTSSSASDCAREVTSRSGSSDFSRCRESGRTIACYQEVRETCRGNLSGESTTRNFREYTGRCAASYSECW